MNVDQDADGLFSSALPLTRSELYVWVFFLVRHYKPQEASRLTNVKTASLMSHIAKGYHYFVTNLTLMQSVVATIHVSHLDHDSYGYIRKWTPRYSVIPRALCIYTDKPVGDMI